MKSDSLDNLIESAKSLGATQAETKIFKAALQTNNKAIIAFITKIINQ